METVGAVSVSTIPQLKANLLTQLQARAGLAGVQIEWGSPSGARSADLIILGDVQRNVEASRTTGHTRREDYTLSVTVSCVATGNDQHTLVTHAFTLVEEIRSQLITDPKVNSSGVQWALPGGEILTEPSTEMQMEARIVMAVNCTALI